MVDEDVFANRAKGYDLIMNGFEDFLRDFIINKVLLLKYGNVDYQDGIPSDIIKTVQEELEKKQIEFDKKMAPSKFFRGALFAHLKEIAVYKDNFDRMRILSGDLSKERFSSLMDDLNNIRNDWIAHPQNIDEKLVQLSEYKISEICQVREEAKDLLALLAKKYSLFKPVPSKTITNLETQDWELDGGFIPRPRELDALLSKINRNQDRVIAIMGSGGVGKTALVTKALRRIINNTNPYHAVLFFSAKDKVLTEHGVIESFSRIPNFDEFIKNLYRSLMPAIQITGRPIEELEDEIINFLDKDKGGHRCLVVLDNLETRMQDERFINFIEKFPRDSQLIITARIAPDTAICKVPLGAFEDDKAAIQLFRAVSGTRYPQVPFLNGLPDSEIGRLVSQVDRVPLLIKWCLSRCVLGREINVAFSLKGTDGEEAIEYVLSDIFELLSEDSRRVLFCISFYEFSYILRPVLMELCGRYGDNFDKTIMEINRAALLTRENNEKTNEEQFGMANVTRTYLQKTLSMKYELLFEEIRTRYSKLRDDIAKQRPYVKEKQFSLIDNADNLFDSQCLALLHIRQAIGGSKKEDNAYAKAEFEKAVGMCPTWFHTYVEYAEFEEIRGAFESALKLYKMASEYAPTNKEILVRESSLKYHLRRITAKELDDMVSIGDTFKIRITQQGEAGDGLGHIGAFSIFVAGANVGDTVKVKISGKLQKLLCLSGTQLPDESPSSVTT